MVLVINCTFVNNIIFNMHPEDTVRNGKIIKTNNFFIYFFQLICDAVHGGSSLLQNKEFNAISSCLDDEQTTLDHELSQLDHSDENQLYHTMEKVQNLLKISAKLQVSKWGKDLTKNTNYQRFIARTQWIQKTAQNYFSRLHSRDERLLELGRWINADSFQQQYAMVNPTGDLPYKAEEVPRGAILLTNCHSYMTGLAVRNLKPTFLQKCKLIRGALTKWVTGYPLMHAEISLGEGRVYHISKRHNFSFSGKGMIEDRSPKWDDRINSSISAYYHKYEVLFPNKENFLKAYNDTVDASRQEKNFDCLLDNILEDIESNGTKVKTSLSAIVGTGFGRTKNSYAGDWKIDYENKEYSCSGCLASFFAQHHIDIGKEFDVNPDKVSPTEFYQSKFFDKLFTTIAN